jgi:hypothetical protein
MLSIGTFGIGKGSQDELRSAKAATTMAAGEDEEDKRHQLTLKRSINGGTEKHRSLRKLMSSNAGVFLPRPSFMGTSPDLKPTEVL